MFTQRLHLGPALPDEDAGPGRVDVQHDLVAGPVDHDLRDAGVVELLLDEAPDLVVLLDLVGVAPLREPIRLPPVEGAQPESIGMYFLTHAFS
jgi:hypothetical protein